MRLSIVSLGLACLLVAPPSPASVHHRAAARRTGSGAARVHGTLAHGPEARQAWHVGGSARDGEGNLGHTRASGVAGPGGRIAGGHRTTKSSDGTITRQGGVVAEGADGGTVRGGRSVQRSPDGAVQAGYTVNGQGAAGGSFSQSASRTRSADGERMASRQTLASGARGSFQGSTTGADGTLDHASTITGANGNSYQGQTSLTRGEGLSHTGTCTNAQGQTFDCK
ncbi:hypothetical protein J7I44_10855 [Frateuria sp. MAH-13]|uniref:ESPR domain-containing protein n=1 Tax=Frateuria flava TaxID=2821489 RepID=A0ABS4DP17_9GAMM|nr:hypothetical protein [Frateuria flava]MBP1474798.1 hypothetical protein [Frateuria flava]